MSLLKEYDRWKRWRSHVIDIDISSGTHVGMQTNARTNISTSTSTSTNTAI
jgi:hypothetical protein